MNDLKETSVDKMLKFFEDIGAAGGAGAFLLITSWGLLVTDLVDFKAANLAALPAAKLLACVGGSLGLLLLLYKLKQASKRETDDRALEADDSNRWERLASFIKDRRAFESLRDYEHLPSMMASVDAVRDYLRRELESLPTGTLLRDDFERMQEATREFASSCDRIWQDRTTMPSHLIDAVPIDQFYFCTSVGILRGQMAAAFKMKSMPQTSKLIARLTGSI